MTSRFTPAFANYIKGGTDPSHYPDTQLPEIAFVGRSNAGKSTLVNLLAGRKGLARTSGTPGRTQAIQFFDIGGKLIFADLPGYGFAQAPEQVRRQFLPMVRTYLQARVNLAAVVLIADIRREPTAHEETILDVVQDRGVPLILALSKSDKLPKSKIKLRIREIADGLGLDSDCFFPCSGLTTQGREELWGALLDLTSEPNPPAGEST